MRRDDDARRTGAFGAPADGAEVAGVGDTVEHREQGSLDAGELVGVGVAVRLDPGDDALMVARPGELGQLTVGPLAGLRLGEPGLGRKRPVGREQLEHLAAAPQRLLHGAPAVDEIARHRRGTSV